MANLYRAPLFKYLKVKMKWVATATETKFCPISKSITSGDAVISVTLLNNM